MEIAHRLSVLYSHQQMSSVEWRYRHLVDTTVTMLRQANLPNQFLDFGVVPTSYLYNRNPTPLLNGKSPLEALLGRSPEYGRFRVFGSTN